MHGLEESDKMFQELKEETMKFEQQQKWEDRRFQLQMMQLVVESACPPHQPVAHHFGSHHLYRVDYGPYNPHSKYDDDSGDAENF